MVSEPLDHAALAARNNAAWCSIVCATHDLHGTVDADAWTWATRTPEFYPDAVTLRRGVDGEALLARIDRSSGCSVKDSFADLDLAASGFDVLFDASWIRFPAASAGPASGPGREDRWRVVRDAAALRDWETAWLDGEIGPRNFRSALLDRDDVAILAIPAHDGALTTAVLNVAAGVVGLSNVVTGEREAAATLSVALDAASQLFPGLDVVGYEQGPMLDAAQQVGFEVTGPLRVWMRD